MIASWIDWSRLPAYTHSSLVDSDCLRFARGDSN